MTRFATKTGFDGGLFAARTENSSVPSGFSDATAATVLNRSSSLSRGAEPVRLAWPPFSRPDTMSGARSWRGALRGSDSRFDVRDDPRGQGHRVRIRADPPRLLIVHSWSAVTPNLDLTPAVSKLSSECLLRIELSTKGPRRAEDGLCRSRMGDRVESTIGQ
jgi:hypothetical protein